VLFPRDAQGTLRLAVGAVALGVEAGKVFSDDFVRRVALGIRIDLVALSDLS
jgi:hypothetical protein